MRRSNSDQALRSIVFGQGDAKDYTTVPAPPPPTTATAGQRPIDMLSEKANIFTYTYLHTPRPKQERINASSSGQGIVMRRSSEPAILAGQEDANNYTVRTWMPEIEDGQADARKRIIMRRSSEPAVLGGQKDANNYTVRTWMPEIEVGQADARKRIIMRRSSEPAVLGGQEAVNNYTVRTWMSEIEVGEADARKRIIMRRSSEPAILGGQEAANNYAVRTWMPEMEVGQGDANDSDFPALHSPINPSQDNTMKGTRNRRSNSESDVPTWDDVCGQGDATTNPWFGWLFVASENHDANAGSNSLSVESRLSYGKQEEIQREDEMRPRVLEGKLGRGDISRFQHASTVGDVERFAVRETPVERVEIRETSGPRARELQHAQLALQRATKRKQKLSEILVARSKEFAEAQSSLKGTLNRDSQEKKLKELWKRKDKLHEAKYFLREVNSQSQSASKQIEGLRLPLQEERINSVAMFSSRKKKR